MKKLNDLKITILCLDDNTATNMSKAFGGMKNVFIVKSDFQTFMADNHKIDCIVSPANSYGYLTGNYDAAISDFLGWDFQKKVQKYIDEKFYGEQPVGTSFYIKTDNNGVGLIHTPTMRIPSRIKDVHLIYQCMRTTLICALEHNVKNIVIPPFGGGCGGIPPKVIATQMRDGYMQVALRRREREF